MNMLMDKISFSNVCIIGDRVWFFEEIYNSLCFININDGVVHYVSSVPNENISMMKQYAGIKHVDGKLYLIPSSAKEIAIYDIKDNMFEKIPLKNYGANSDIIDGYNSNIKFWNAIEFDNALYFIPRKYPAIVKLNCSLKTLTYFDSWVEKINPYILRKNRAYFGRDVIFENNKILMISWNSNLCMEFSLENYDTKFIKIDKECTCIAKSNKKIFLLEASGCGADVYVDYNFEEVQSCMYPENFKGEKPNFHFTYVLGNTIFLVPEESNMLVGIDTLTLKSFCVKKVSKQKSMFCRCAWRTGKYLAFFDFAEQAIEFYDEKGNFKNKLAIIIDENYISRLSKYLEGLKSESKRYGLIDYMRCIQRKNSKVNNSERNDIGKDIYLYEM